jgi:hypothetical protein
MSSQQNSTHQQNFAEKRRNVLARVANGDMTAEDAEHALSRLQFRKVPHPYARVTNNGSVAVYNLMPHKPVVMTSNQWKRLIAFVESGRLSQFLTSNNGRLRQGKRNFTAHNNRYENNNTNSQDGTAEVTTETVENKSAVSNESSDLVEV